MKRFILADHFIQTIHMNQAFHFSTIFYNVNASNVKNPEIWALWENLNRLIFNFRS